MTKTKEHAVSRRTFVKGSALAGLGAAALGTGTLFACSPQGTDEVSGGASETVDEKVVWGHCSVNCEGRCALRLHVTNDEVAWVESDNTGDDVYGDHQIRACLRGRSIRRWINHPDRLAYPMKRVFLSVVLPYIFYLILRADGTHLSCFHGCYKGCP